jgi:DNA repair exonuclease SbcCD nuclease subunit
MIDFVNRRDFIKLAGIGVVVFVSRSAVSANGLQQENDSFYFVQLSDTHWGFNRPDINPDSQGTLKKAVAAVNGLDEQPDFVVFTGDLTQTTDDRTVRRDRMAEFREIVSQLRVKTVRFMPGEHDASLDRGDAYQEFFGDLHYVFDHKNIHFIALDNVSDPMAAVGEEQLDWLQSDLKQVKSDGRIVVLTHRPLFDLAPDWDCGHSPSLAPSPKKLKYLGMQQSRIKGSAFEMSRRESHKDATRSKNFRFREDNEHEKHLTQRHLDCRVGRYVPATNGR